MAEIIQPQQGYQTKVLTNPADIIFSGAAAGVGKTFGLLLDFARHTPVPKWGGVIFRRTSPQIRSEGGLWDTSRDLFTKIKGAVPKESSLEWSFKSGAGLKFSHLEYEKNIYDWQGSQIPFIGFDELTHFTKRMFFYLLSRNRSTCGIRPVVRATLNPDPEFWGIELISWYIDWDTGIAIPERDGVVRWFVRDGDTYVWGDSFQEVYEKSKYLIDPQIESSKGKLQPRDFVKSFSFISGSIYDNEALLTVNPEYLANLLAQDEDDRNRLLYSNWKSIPNDLDIYDYNKFLGVFDNIKEAEKGEKCITADIAMQGSNKFIIGYWEGFSLENVEVIDKSNGKEVIDGISAFAKYYNVPNDRICYDADGVGAYVDGFISGAIPFNGGTPAREVIDKASEKRIKENYFNLKTQCYYRSGKRVTDGGYKVSEVVANKMYDNKMTVRQRFMHERKAIKRDKPDTDSKLRIISKEEMKTKLNGESPDLLDMFMMREMFELVPKRNWIAI